MWWAAALVCAGRLVSACGADAIDAFGPPEQHRPEPTPDADDVVAQPDGAAVAVTSLGRPVSFEGRTLTPTGEDDVLLLQLLP